VCPADVCLLADRGDLEGAERCCRELLQTDRLNPIVHFYHALVAIQQGRSGQAEEALRRSLYLDRQFVLAHYHLGLLLQQQGQRQRAGRSFHNVLELLAARPADQVLPAGDGMTAADLNRLTRLHLQMLEGT
jgi:chemotaxis protein methyltransferase CheR